ncbi:hypothetical protein KSP40_PGU005107 [Platanthera guangdongensis]|uniref:Plastocyanin-like domain-containing protein n=1 Tax=Platanthera guangdongensis TaxID=2320717 RepID=A0ABR2MLH5_9ASPA
MGEPPPFPPNPLLGSHNPHRLSPHRRPHCCTRSWRNQPPGIDGHPNAWFTSNFSFVGPSFVSPTSSYPNCQDPGNLWYHDHALGLTRVNLLTGLIGAYTLRSHDLESPLRLPTGSNFDRHLFLFDRSFYANGTLFLNSTGDNPSIHPQWQPEYFGDVIIVNGKAWPFLSVLRRRYRFRIINASNARFYRLCFSIPSASSTSAPTLFTSAAPCPLKNFSSAPPKSPTSSSISPIPPPTPPFSSTMLPTRSRQATRRMSLAAR